MKTAMDMLDRMETLVRKMANRCEPPSYVLSGTDYTEARAIVAELPAPVDPLLLEAREAIKATYGDVYGTDGKVLPGGGPERVNNILTGKPGSEQYWEVQAILAALRRGRALERGG